MKKSSIAKRGILIPYKLRWLNKIYADIFGYFWLPCPICGDCFGGHEWIEGHDLHITQFSAKGICPKLSCKAVADKRNKKLFSLTNIST